MCRIARFLRPRKSELTRPEINGHQWDKWWGRPTLSGYGRRRRRRPIQVTKQGRAYIINTTLPFCFQYWPYYFVSMAVFLPRPRQNTGHLNKRLVPILKTPGNIVHVFNGWLVWPSDHLQYWYLFCLSSVSIDPMSLLSVYFKWKKKTQLRAITKSNSMSTINPVFYYSARLIMHNHHLSTENIKFISQQIVIARLKGLAQAKLIKKSVILFWVLNMTIWM